jgi:hypothetical protein
MTYFIDAQGVVRHIERGALTDQDEIRAAIAKAR